MQHSVAVYWREFEILRFLDADLSAAPLGPTALANSRTGQCRGGSIVVTADWCLPTDSVRPGLAQVSVAATRRPSQGRCWGRSAAIPGLRVAGRRRLDDCTRAMLIAGYVHGLPKVGWDSAFASL
jgi:hypothetical protein